MTPDRRFEHDLPELLADLYLGPAPDYRHDVVRLIARTPQRRAWMFPERWIPMSVTTLARQVGRPAPWRTVALLAILALLLAAALAIVVGTPRPLPAPFGPAQNGLVVLEKQGDIYLVDPGTGLERLAISGPELDSSPVFSRDGTRLAFFRGTGTGVGLMVADDRGQAIRQLSMDGVGELHSIEWSPDGRSIMVNAVMDGLRGILIVPTDGSAAHRLDIGMSAEDPVWLPPAGDEILFRTPSADGSEYGFGVHAVRADGTEVRTLVPAKGAGAEGCDTVERFCEFDGLFFGASPDGSQVAYQLRDQRDGIQKIYVLPVAGGRSTELTTVESVFPTWSPDGAWIGFFGEDGYYVVPSDGSGTQARLMTTAPEGLPARWASDGRHVWLLDRTGKVFLLDPSGEVAEAPWTLQAVPEVFPDWQRLGAR